MNFPLGFDDLTILLAVTSITLLVTSEILSPYYGKMNVGINKKRLRQVAVMISMLFLVSVAIRIANLLT